MNLAQPILATLVCLCLLHPSIPAKEFEVPCEIHEKHKAILVEVQVNGKDRIFVFDTGAARTVVSPRVLGGLAEFELKMSRFRSREPGLKGEAMWEQVRSFRLGRQVWYDLRVVVMNLEEVSRIYGRPIDGLLGQDLLSEFESVTIDFRNKKVIFSR